VIDRVCDLEREALEALGEAGDERSLEEWRLRYLARSGRLSMLLRGLGDLPDADRPAAGKEANRVKLALESAHAAVSRRIETARLEVATSIDVTLPGRRGPRGGLHPVTRIVREIVAVFGQLGFRVSEGPEVEFDSYNFERLNIPPDHPARDMHDTYWLDIPGRSGQILLRTHTSPNQIRIMERQRPPIRVVVPGKVYRYEAVDATHETMFFQVEGLAVDRGITMADLKGTLATFARAMFGSERRVMFYSAYFPFVEPGVEVAIDCFSCGGSGCRTCKGTGWIEIMGAGMVHPHVLRGVGYDPDEYTGFAFGLGPERVAMLRYGIPDIRLFYSNDLRFLRQFH